jgi:hypothetical protein
MNAGLQRFRWWQALGVDRVKIHHQADRSFGREIATADSEASNFDEAGKGGRRANHQGCLMLPDMDTVIPDQFGRCQMARAAGQQEIEGKARFAGAGWPANKDGAVSHAHGGCVDTG